MTGFELHDSVNRNGEVAFWVQTPHGDAVLKAGCNQQITCHRVQPEALVFSPADPVDQPLVVTNDPALLLRQPRVTEGLIADGVTPLLLQLSLATPPDQPTSYTIHVSVDPTSGSLAIPVETHLQVIQDSRFVIGNTLRLSSANPTNFACLSGIRAEDVQLNAGQT